MVANSMILVAMVSSYANSRIADRAHSNAMPMDAHGLVIEGVGMLQINSDRPESLGQI